MPFSILKLILGDYFTSKLRFYVKVTLFQLQYEKVCIFFNMYIFLEKKYYVTNIFLSSIILVLLNSNLVEKF